MNEQVRHYTSSHAMLRTLQHTFALPKLHVNCVNIELLYKVSNTAYDKKVVTTPSVHCLFPISTRTM